MTELLKGAPVAEALNEQTRALSSRLREKGIVPTLAILRIGERRDDISYEKTARKRAESVGIAVRTSVLPEDTPAPAFFAALDGLNADPSIHGILLFRPLPKGIDEDEARARISPEKDVDGCTDASLAGVFTGSGVGFAPCTAEAAVSILEHYGIDCRGKRAVVLGRSLVVGRPAAMLLLHRNATVTLCHSHTGDAAALAREADILLVATGRQESIGREYFREGQIVLDVGIHFSAEKGRLTGDVRREEAEELVSAITPVPGGIGTVTTSVLLLPTALSAERSTR